jgi:hypothetical protein
LVEVPEIMRHMKSILSYQKKNSQVLDLHSDLLQESFNPITEINRSEIFLSEKRSMTSVSKEKHGKVLGFSLFLSLSQNDEAPPSQKSQP